jgi:hypothetical protein
MIVSRSIANTIARRTDRGRQPGVEPVETEADHRPPDVDVAVVGGQRSAVGAQRDRPVLEVALQELVVHRVPLIAREDPIDEARDLWRPVEVIRDRAEDDLFAALPANELEGPGADGLRAERGSLSLDQVSGHDLRLAHGDHGDERHGRLLQGDLHGVPVERHQALDGPRTPLGELPRALDVQEQLGRAGLRPGIEQARERIDDVVGDDLAPVVELHSLAELERPREPVPRRAPECGEGRLDREGLIELDEAVEDLLRHRAAIRVGDPCGIESPGPAPEVADRCRYRAPGPSSGVPIRR